MNYDCQKIAIALAAPYGKHPRHSGEEWTTNCPCHPDDTGSLTVREKNDTLVVKCHAGCDQNLVFAEVSKLADVASTSNHKRQVEAIYRYRDSAGSILFEKVRYIPKDFRVRRTDGNGSYIWNTKDVDTSVPYRLPEVLDAIKNQQVIWFTEGEKDADNLLMLGLVATCNLQGASQDNKKPKWTDRHSKWFSGLQEAIILPDNDDAGRAHANAIAESLTGIGIKCKILELQGLSAKGDVSDWIATGGTKDQLLELATDAEIWTKILKGTDAEQTSNASAG